MIISIYTWKTFDNIQHFPMKTTPSSIRGKIPRYNKGYIWEANKYYPEWGKSESFLWYKIWYKTRMPNFTTLCSIELDFLARAIALRKEIKNIQNRKRNQIVTLSMLWFYTEENPKNTKEQFKLINLSQLKSVMSTYTIQYYCHTSIVKHLKIY